MLAARDELARPISDFGGINLGHAQPVTGMIDRQPRLDGRTKEARAAKANAA